MAKKGLKDRLRERQENLKKSNDGFAYFITAEGTTMVRPLWCGEEQDWAIEVQVLYLSKDLGNLISPSTFGEKCAFKQKYDELSQSDDSGDRAYAKKIRLGKKFMFPAVRFNDKGEVDTQNGAKPYLITKNLYDDMLELYLDDDNGDFTDPTETGYNLKFKRTGTGKLDTKYSVIKGKNCKAPKGFRGPYNIEEMVKAITPSYKQTKIMLEEFMRMRVDDDDDAAEEAPKKKKKKKSDI